MIKVDCLLSKTTLECLREIQIYSGKTEFWAYGLMDLGRYKSIAYEIAICQGNNWYECMQDIDNMDDGEEYPHIVIVKHNSEAGRVSSNAFEPRERFFGVNTEGIRKEIGWYRIGSMSEAYKISYFRDKLISSRETKMDGTIWKQRQIDSAIIFESISDSIAFQATNIANFLKVCYSENEFITFEDLWSYYYIDDESIEYDRILGDDEYYKCDRKRATSRVKNPLLV